MVTTMVVLKSYSKMKIGFSISFGFSASSNLF